MFLDLFKDNRSGAKPSHTELPEFTPDVDTRKIVTTHAKTQTDMRNEASPLRPLWYSLEAFMYTANSYGGIPWLIRSTTRSMTYPLGLGSTF